MAMKGENIGRKLSFNHDGNEDFKKNIIIIAQEAEKIIEHVPAKDFYELTNLLNNYRH